MGYFTPLGTDLYFEINSSKKHKDVKKVPTIILVEDNELILNSLAFSLTQEGYNVQKAKNEEETFKLLDERTNLVILDITLPDGNGFEICKKIKEKRDIPIIFLTAKDEEKDIVYGLELGADDYVTKPFRIRELISRIKTVLRRYNQGKEKSNLIKIKDVSINTERGFAYKNGKELELTALEYKILLMLFIIFGNIITREQILDKIWDIAGNFVNDNTLTVYIKRIREKIEDDPANPTIIKTVRGIGYRVGD